MKNHIFLLFVAFLSFLLLQTCDSPTSEPPPLIDIDRPFDLTASKGNYLDRISLTWNSAPTSSTFQVFRYDSVETYFILIGETSDKSFVDSTVTKPDINYYYKVRGTSEDGNESPFSDVVIGSIRSFRMSKWLFIEDNSEEGFISIDWSSADGSDGFEVYRSVRDTLNFQLLTTTTESNYNDSDVEILTDYYYKVRAYSSKYGKTPFTEIEPGYLKQKYSLIRVIGKEGSGEKEFQEPYSVLFDTDGNYYVSEAGGQRIQKFSPNDDFIEVFASVNTPRGMEWSGNGTIIVSISGQGFMAEYDLSGNLISKWDESLNNLREVDIDDSKNIYLADFYHDKIKKYDVNHNLTLEWGDTEEPLVNPWGIEVVENEVVVGDANSILFYSTDGTFIKKWYFNRTAYYISYFDNYFYVSFGNHVKKLDLQGNVVAEIGLNDLQLAGGIAFNSNGQLYIADGLNNSIYVYKNGY